MAVAVESLLTADIAKPGRYLGNELGAVHKNWDAAAVRWALTYPEVYEVGASNLGHIILYNILNSQANQLCDRAYLPGADLAAKLRETGTPLFAVESRRYLGEFDILGFSLSYELGATNILEMLDLAQVPLTWAERQTASITEIPLVFAGGQTATSNPEPYTDFFDFFALGDGEEVLPEIGEVVAQGKAAGLNRVELLLNLAQVPGVYVPQFYQREESGSVIRCREDVPERILRRVATPRPEFSIGLVPFVETVHDRLTVEIRRGCTRGCRFCQPGMLTRPARDVDPDQVIETIEKGMRATGYNEFSLLSLSCSDYLALPAVGLEIKNRLKDENISLSLPSQRVDRFDQNIANILGGTRQGSITFAPEAGTQRLRDIINKGLTNEELLRGVKTAYEQGWDKVKLYFMIGLPGELDADVLGIAETIRWLKSECWQKGRKPMSFNVTISNFTPKPHTPFQWHSVSTEEFTRKQELLRAEFRTIRGLKVNFTDIRISAMEDFVGRGDRRLGKVIYKAWKLGAREDSWWESVERAYQAWADAIEAAGLTWQYRKVAAGEWNIFETQSDESQAKTTKEILADWNLDAPLPWDHIETGVSKRWLKTDLKKALEAVVVPDCSFDACYSCGVCGSDFGHNVVVPPLPIPEFQGQPQAHGEKVQRLRVWFGKLGDLALISHLDLLRLFDRALRRASLPISFTNGFHPSPRIAPANALPLGMTSTGEIVDFELWQPCDPVEFQARLAVQLPTDLPLYQVQEIPLSASSATQILDRAEYVLTVNCEGDETGAWKEWIGEILNTTEFPYETKTKSGKKKLVNLRERLFELELLETTPQARIRYVGSCRNDGTLLRPEHLIMMLEKVSGKAMVLLQANRVKLVLQPMS